MILNYIYDTEHTITQGRLFVKRVAHLSRPRGQTTARAELKSMGLAHSYCGHTMISTVDKKEFLYYTLFNL